MTATITLIARDDDVTADEFSSTGWIRVLDADGDEIDAIAYDADEDVEAADRNIAAALADAGIRLQGGWTRGLIDGAFPGTTAVAVTAR